MLDVENRAHKSADLGLVFLFRCLCLERFVSYSLGGTLARLGGGGGGSARERVVVMTQPCSFFAPPAFIVVSR